MKTITLYTLTLTVALALTLNLATAQNNSSKLQPESTMTLSGTSTIHDWEADVEQINLEADFSDELFSSPAPASADFINALKVTVPVESIESGKGGMNNKIYGALKQEKHPNITFTFGNAELTASDEAAGTFTLNARGELNVAGQARTISFPVEGTISESENVQFTGSYKLNMKDYGIDPPSAVFGTIKSGEEVTISFDIIVSNQAVANNN